MNGGKIIFVNFQRQEWTLKLRYVQISKARSNKMLTILILQDIIAWNQATLMV